jgi:hypothetical protein
VAFESALQLVFEATEGSPDAAVPGERLAEVGLP